jgi:hypothetical protein
MSWDQAGLARRGDVREDMNNVRRELARRNPRGYSAPVNVRVDDRTIVVDLLPLSFVSSVIEKAIAGLEERDPAATALKIPGRIPVDAVKIVVAYADGSSRAQNWAADLDATPSLAAYVWDLACLLKVDGLERLVRKAAFSTYTHSLSSETAARLLLRARKRGDETLYTAAKMFICYNLTACARGPEWGELSQRELARVLDSQHVRATQAQRYEAIAQWQMQTPEGAEDRQEGFYTLLGKLHWPLLSPRVPGNEDALAYREFSERIEYVNVGQLIPVGAAVERRVRRAAFAAFQLNPQMDGDGHAGLLKAAAKNREEEADRYARAGLLKAAAESKRDPHGERDAEAPRFRGQFKAFNYYWQVEVPWYGRHDVDGGPALGCYLRLLHGSDMAGLRKRSDVIGLQTAFMLRLHCSDNFDRCLKTYGPLDVDMLNLPGRRKSYGCRYLLDAAECRRMLKKMPDLYVSVEIRRVREMTAKNADY